MPLTALLRPVFRLVLPGLWVLLLGACSSLPHSSRDSRFSFIDMGDMPYGVTDANGRSDADILDGIADKVASSGTWPFVVHHGDLGRPPKVCNDAALEQTLQFWQTRIRVPVFYTPGDNEWEDCDRDDVQPAAGHAAAVMGQPAPGMPPIILTDEYGRPAMRAAVTWRLPPELIERLRAEQKQAREMLDRLQAESAGQPTAGPGAAAQPSGTQPPAAKPPVPKPAAPGGAAPKPSSGPAARPPAAAGGQPGPAAPRP